MTGAVSGLIVCIYLNLLWRLQYGPTIFLEPRNESTGVSQVEQVLPSGRRPDAARIQSQVHTRRIRYGHTDIQTDFFYHYFFFVILLLLFIIFIFYYYYFLLVICLDKTGSIRSLALSTNRWSVKCGTRLACLSFPIPIEKLARKAIRFFLPFPSGFR